MYVRVLKQATRALNQVLWNFKKLEELFQKMSRMQAKSDK